MGVTVKQKVKGKGNPWWVFINQQGKRKSKMIGDKQSAERVAAEIRTKLKLGEFKIDDDKRLPMFREYANKWLEGYIGVLRRESTRERYQGILDKHIYPVFSEKRLDQITKGDIRDLLASQIGEGYSRSTVGLSRDVISGIFNYALDEELLTSNPSTGITKRMDFSRKKNKPEIEPLSREELALYLDTCRGNYPEFYPFFLCLARTGIRLGEAIAMQFENIDFNSKYIWIKRSYRRGRFTAPKNGKTRKVDMSNQLIDVLKNLMTARKKEALRRGKGETSELVFAKDEKVMEQNYVRKIHNRILRKAGLRKIRIHDIRHSYASLLLTQGESPVYVKEQLGHHSIQMTVDIYGHLIPSANRQAVNQLDDLSAPPPHPEANLDNQHIGNSQERNEWCRRRDSNSHGIAPTRP
jgi:integrase